VWFSDSVTPTIRGQWASQTSSLSSESYAYDGLDRLDEVQETPAGKGCVVRVYGLDDSGNRTSLITREPGPEGRCASEGGTVQTHTYDTANRLVDPGVQYNAFGDITSLPAGDAGGSTLQSEYYADGQLTEQSQEGVTQGYQLDPGRRFAEVATTSSKGAAASLIDHYSREGAAPAWTTETSGKWARDTYGINGVLAAIQTDGESPVLQLGNLHGDIIGTAADEETATKLLSSTNTTEYGVPTTGSPSRYSWLGTQKLPTEFPSGVVAMGVRSYVPQLGRFLQPDPKAGGSESAYAYVHGNPLNETDASGQWSLDQTSGGLSAVGTGEGVQLPGGVGIAAGAIMPAPVNAQLEAAFWASPPWDQETAGNEEYEEYEWEEEGGYEETAYHPGSKPAGEEAHAEEGLLYQSLGEEEYGQQRQHEMSSLAALCQNELSGHPEGAARGACARYASIFGKIWHAVEHAWHTLVRGVKHVGKTLNELYWSLRGWWNLNQSFIHHWQCNIEGAGIGLVAGEAGEAAGPWASGYIGTGAGIAATEICDHA